MAGKWPEKPALDVVVLALGDPARFEKAFEGGKVKLQGLKVRVLVGVCKDG